MLEIIALLCLIGAMAVLFFLSSIDLREGLLPNELVLGFLSLGFVFHLCTLFYFMPMHDAFLGCLVGGGILYAIRFLANMYYGDDALGLGDVKLMGAGGVWLGPYYILVAMSFGALVGILHGLLIAFRTKKQTRKKFDMSRLSLPAGPGFAIGIVLTAALKFWEFPHLLLLALGL